MNNKSILYGALSGILAGMALTWSVDYWGLDSSGSGRATASSRSFGGLTRSQSSGLEFDKDKSLLSQTGTRLDTLLRYYSQMTSEELHSEIARIDTEKKSDPTGTLSDAIAIMYLAYCWGLQDAEKAHKYSKSEYLDSNMALRSSSWYMLVVQAWAERDPERAYQFSCRKYLEELVRNSVEEGKSSSDEIDWYGPSIRSSSPPEDLEPHNDVFNIQGAVERIESAYAKFFPNEALQWVGTRCIRDDYYGVSYTHDQYPDIPYAVLESFAWNHPEKLLSFRENDPRGFDIHQLLPSTKSEIALILKESNPLSFDEWMKKFPEEEQKSIVNNLEHKEKLGNEETAFSYFEKLPDDKKKNARYSIILALKDKAPEKVMDWLSVEYDDNKLAEKENRDELIRLCSSFQPESRTSASRFKAYLEQLPPSRFRADLSTVTLLNCSSFGYEFEDILSLAKMCENKNTIDYGVIDYSLYIWERCNNDYEKMKGSFEKLNLSPEQETQLRKKYSFLPSSEK